MLVRAMAVVLSPLVTALIFEVSPMVPARYLAGLGVLTLILLVSPLGSGNQVSSFDRTITLGVIEMVDGTVHAIRFPTFLIG